MSSEIINREFSDFGSKMKSIAILTLIGLILTIASIFFVFAALINIVIQIVIIIFFLLLIGDIKKVGRELNNENLLGFPLKFILGTILRFIGQQLFSFGLLLMIDIFIYGGGRAFFLLSILLILIGIALIEFGSILRLLAWSGLQNFFTANLNLFPANIGNEGRYGSKYCKIASIFDMLILIPLIGDIFRIVGYFKLASLKNLIGGPVQPTSQPVTPMSTPVEAQSVNYCPSCGSHIGMGVNFCPNCGAEIN